MMRYSFQIKRVENTDNFEVLGWTVVSHVDTITFKVEILPAHIHSKIFIMSLKFYTYQVYGIY